MKSVETELQKVTNALNEVTKTNKQFEQACIERRKTGSDDYTNSNAMEALYTAAIEELSKSLEENKSCTESSYKKHIVLTFNDIYIRIADLENLQQSKSQRSLYNLFMYANDWDTFYSINFLMAPNEHLLRLFYFKGAFREAEQPETLLHNFAKLNMQDVIKDFFKHQHDKSKFISLIHLDLSQTSLPNIVLPSKISDLTTTILQASDKTTRNALLKGKDKDANTALHLAVKYNTLHKIFNVQDIKISELLAIKNNKDQIPADFIVADHKEKQTRQIADAIALEEANNFQLFNLTTKSHFIPTHVNLVFQNLAKLHKESLSSYKQHYFGTTFQQALPQTNNTNINYSKNIIIGACFISATILSLLASYTSRDEGRGL